MYAINKLNVLYSKKDVDVLSMIDDHAIEAYEKFTYDDGFNIAVGLTAYDNNKEIILDPAYGELVWTHYSWNLKADEEEEEEEEQTMEESSKADGSITNVGTIDNSLKTHYCSRDELGLDGLKESTTFMPLH